jgi:hypothetical protein
MRNAERGWWEGRTCGLLVVAATLLPLAYPPIPPLVDLLGHIGRYRVELDLGRSAWLSHYYSFRWSPIGNLGVDVIVRLLSPLLGVEPAAKLVVAAIPALTAAAFLWIAREVHGRIPPTAFLAVPFAFGHPFQYGFVNYALAMALALLAFAFWLRLGRLGRTRLRALLFVPISVLLYFAHAFGWAVLGLLCLCAEVERRHEQGARWARSISLSVAAVAVMALPAFIIFAWRSGMTGPIAWAWFDWQAKLVWFETALRDRWQAFDLASVVLVAAVLVFAMRSARLRFSPQLAVPALALLVVFLLLPTTLFASAYADMRLAPYIIALLVLAIGAPGPGEERLGRGLAVLAIGFVAVRLTANTISFADSWNEQRQEIAAINRLPSGSRVAAFVGFPCGGGWAMARNSHLGSLVTIRRDGFSNDQWIMPGASGLDVVYRAPGYFAADPSQLVLPNGCSDGLHRPVDQALGQFPRQAFDYLWLIDVPPYDPRLVAGLEPVSAQRGSLLFRLPGAAARR